MISTASVSKTPASQNNAKPASLKSSLSQDSSKPSVSKADKQRKRGNERRRNQEAAIKKSKPTNCACRNNRCIKLYCVCFSADKYCTEICKCDAGKCDNQSQNSLRDSLRYLARLKNQRNFSKPVGATLKVSCTCKKCNCLKRYCDCFVAGAKCGRDCSCIGCENVEIN